MGVLQGRCGPFSKTFELQPDCKLCSEPLEKKPEKPVFVTKFSSAIATVGNTAKFTVTVSGFPRPVIQWYHNGQLIQSSSFYTFVQEKEEHSLFITNITKELEGEYSCTASNRFGKSTSIEHVKYAAGSHALFEYTVAGVPLPDVQWYRGSNHMQPSKYCIVVNNTDGSGYLKILGIQQSDSGLYSCRASNPLGETSCSMIYTTSTEDRQTVTSEQTDTLHALDISAATVHLEQVTRQATVIQSHDVQERVKVAPAQPKPVVATPLKQLHMAAITSA
uniref:Ig-like domain-containing protein n=1 Tax=Sinocyclocheilus anshuiensis TaxID=1608454 RepID=A0A671KQH9_9TELE